VREVRRPLSPANGARGWGRQDHGFAPVAMVCPPCRGWGRNGEEFGDWRAESESESWWRSSLTPGGVGRFEPRVSTRGC
jgi:hypothetical protein